MTRVDELGLRVLLTLGSNLRNTRLGKYLFPFFSSCIGLIFKLS